MTLLPFRKRSPLASDVAISRGYVNIEVEIYLALKHLPTWNVNIPKYVIKIAKSRYIHSALIISQSFIALALEIANKFLAAEFGGIKLLLSFADTKTQASLSRPNL
jgi:hypothetical protein